MKTEILAELNSLQFDFANLTPEKMTHIRDLILEYTRLTFDGIGSLLTSTEPLTFENVVQPLILQETLCETPGENHMVFAMMKKVHPDPKVRELASEAETAYLQLKIDAWQRDDVYQVFSKYEAGNYQQEKATRDYEEQLYVTRKMRDFARAGMSLDADKRAELKQAQRRIVELSEEAEQNLSNVKTEFEFTRAELQGMPEGWFTESRLLRKGETSEQDVFKVTLKYPDVFPILDYADNREVRKAIHIGFNAQCADTNLPILAELVRLRTKVAKLLGYASFSDYKAETRMAKSAANIQEFYQRLATGFKSGAQRNLDDLSELARKETGDANFVLEGWDMSYYMNKRVKALYDIDHKVISEYFPYSKVESGIMQVYQDVLGLKFVKTDNPQYNYHPDVSCYDVYDAQNGQKLGSFILDMFPRDGKYTHACCEELIAGSSKNLPLSILICNLSKDEGLTIDEVETYFHEFGHLMHCICSRHKLASMAGFNIELDAVEAPSQMLERWVYDQRVQKQLSSHVKTGDVIPEALTKNLLEAQKLHAPYEKTRQLLQGMYDQEVHALGETATAENVLSLFQSMGTKIGGISTAQSKMPARFGHLYKDYAASYYSYLWADNMAADMFETIFAKDPLDPKAGMHYRKTILEPGATKGFAELVRDFLGRDPEPGAYLRYCGIETKAETDKPTQKLRMM